MRRRAWLRPPAVVERRYAEGQPERAAELAAELVQLKVDVILTTSPATREAASKATRSIPIVTVSGSDPEREGWARSLARPGGNVTGLTVTYPGLSAKRFEILKSAFPSLARLAVLIDPAELPNPKQVVLDMEAGAKLNEPTPGFPFRRQCCHGRARNAALGAERRGRHAPRRWARIQRRPGTRSTSNPSRTRCTASVGSKRLGTGLA
ncbi:MAG: ABC transporter substrate binding protein [Rubrivivax sp.]